MQLFSRERLTGGSGCLVAMAIGLITVTVAYGVVWLVGGKATDIAHEWDLLLLQVLLVAAPFGLLALAGRAGPVEWPTAVILTVAFWGLSLTFGLANGERGGANIGLGLFMLASPVMILVGSAIVRALFERNPGRAAIRVVQDEAVTTMPIYNNLSTGLTIIVEPLCNEYEIPPGGRAIIDLQSGHPHSIEIHDEQRILIWDAGFEGAIVRIEDANQTSRHAPDKPTMPDE